jgi:hypothetical protein
MGFFNGLDLIGGFLLAAGIERGTVLGGGKGLTSPLVKKASSYLRKVTIKYT